MPYPRPRPANPRHLVILRTEGVQSRRPRADAEPVQQDDAVAATADTRADGPRAGLPSATSTAVSFLDSRDAPTDLPATRLRPLTRRRHVRVAGATAADVERLSWLGAEADEFVGVAAVSVVPGASMSPRAVRPQPAGADLDLLLGTEDLGCRPGRHRRDRLTWQLLRHVPGFRPSPAAWDVDEDSSPRHALSIEPAPSRRARRSRQAPEVRASGPASGQAAGRAAGAAGAPADPPTATGRPARRRLRPSTAAAFDAPFDAPFEGPFDAPAEPGPGSHAVVADRPNGGTDAGTHDDTTSDRPGAVRLDDEIAAAADLRVPTQREGSRPWFQRRRRSPAPLLRAQIQAAGVRLQQAQGQAEIARVASEEAARLVGADVSAFVLRSVEGPRVLWMHPGGPDAGDLWGPATLAALLGVGHPVRRVVEGDPLADGAATALLAVPVPSGGALAGTLLVRRHEPRAFGALEQDLLSRLARMAGAAMLATTRRVAYERGELDDVTRLPGGSRLVGDAAAAVRTADRAGMPVSVLAAHVEGLAPLRTELGAPPADDLMAALARAFSGVLRIGDVAYRIGEDEFALLLPATDAEALTPIRERLEAVTAEVVADTSLPGGPRRILLRTAVVPLGAVRVGGDAVDAAVQALDLDRPKVRWQSGRGPVGL